MKIRREVISLQCAIAIAESGLLVICKPDGRSRPGTSFLPAMADDTQAAEQLARREAGDDTRSVAAAGRSPPGDGTRSVVAAGKPPPGDGTPSPEAGESSAARAQGA